MRLQQFEKLQDKATITKILGGDLALYVILIRRYNPYLFKIGRSYGFVLAILKILCNKHLLMLT